MQLFEAKLMRFFFCFVFFKVTDTQDIIDIMLCGSKPMAVLCYCVVTDIYISRCKISIISTSYYYYMISSTGENITLIISLYSDYVSSPWFTSLFL